jgi:hypothetical protein
MTTALKQNDRLAEQNRALSSMLASQAAQMAKFQSDLFASLASQFDTFRQAQGESLSSDVDALRDSLGRGHESRLAAADTRDANLTVLEENEKELGGALQHGQARAKELVKAGETVRFPSFPSRQRIRSL